MANKILNKISTFSKVKQTITYFLLIVSFVSAITGATWSVAKWVIKKDTQANVSVSSFEKSVKTDSLQNIKIDIIIEKLEKLDVIDEKVNALQNSYVLYMKNTLTKEDLRDYMEGITWEEKKTVSKQSNIPVKTDTTDFNIKINKIIK